MTDYTKLQSRCQRGESSLAGANNLLAECYGVLGKLIAENERLGLELKDFQWGASVEAEAGDEARTEVSKLRAEIAGLKTGYQAYEQVNAELKAEVEGLRKFLLDASEEIADWGAYASAYFQEKHDLAGCVAKFHAAAMGKGEQS